MSVEHASLVDKERRNAQETSLDVAIAERPASYAATPMENERNRNGKNACCDFPLYGHSSGDSARQLASLSAKVQAYEDVIKKLSNRFGVSDEQLVNVALAVVRSQALFNCPHLKGTRTLLQTYL